VCGRSSLRHLVLPRSLYKTGVVLCHGLVHLLRPHEAPSWHSDQSIKSRYTQSVDQWVAVSLMSTVCCCVVHKSPIFHHEFLTVYSVAGRQTFDVFMNPIVVNLHFSTLAQASWTCGGGGGGASSSVHCLLSLFWCAPPTQDFTSLTAFRPKRDTVTCCFNDLLSPKLLSAATHVRPRGVYAHTPLSDVTSDGCPG
jgi:hypothetical protein